MHVGLLIYGTLDTLSGGYLYDRKLVEHLQSKGSEVEIISLPWRNYARHLGDNLLTGLHNRLRDLQVNLLLQDELNHPSLFWLNRRLQKHINYPIIAIVHHLRSSEMHPALNKRIYRWIERYYLSTVDGFIYNSQATRQMVEKMGRAERPAVVAFPGRDHLNSQSSESEIIQRAHDPGPLRLLFLGNIIPRKGLHTLLKAVSRSPKEHWRLRVVGDLQVDPDYVRKIHYQIESNSLSDNIKLLGRLNEKELSAQMFRSQVLVVPSSYEGFGIVYLEGMGSGLPAIACTAGGAGEIITHGKDGFLVEPGDFISLSSWINELSNNRNRLKELSQAARQRYLLHPTWNQTGNQIDSFLASLVK
jgi:glycosyltransferase involved in cell wall biosynthesis